MAARTFTLVLAAVVLMASASARSPTDLAANPRSLKQAGACTHTIVAGDTFFALAQKYGTTVAALQAANPSAIPTNLQIGQVIKLPTCPGGRKLLQAGACTHTIVSGDTFFALAQKYGTTVAAIQAANPSAIPTNLQIGQVIKLPTCAGGRKLMQAGACTHTIVAGDTFFALAQKYGTTVAALQAANPSAIPTNLQIGQVIKLPTCAGGR